MLCTHALFNHDHTQPPLHLDIFFSQGNCFGQVFDGEEAEDDEDDEDDDTADGNVAYAACDLVGAFAKVRVV